MIFRKDEDTGKITPCHPNTARLLLGMEGYTARKFSINTTHGKRCGVIIEKA